MHKLFCKQYNGDLLRLFSFASEHKLNLALGNYEKLIDDCKKIGQNLVVDALTLVIIAYHGCLPVLDGFSHVYVNWRSVANLLQNCSGIKVDKCGVFEEAIQSIT